MTSLRRRRASCAARLFANGNVHSAAQAQALLAKTGVRGLMIGAAPSAIRGCSTRIRAQLRGEPIQLPTGRDVLTYIRELWENEITPGVKESSQVMRMKKFLNFIGDGVGEKFLHDIRRVATTADFFRVCENYLAHDQPLTAGAVSVAEAALDLPAAF